MSIKFRLTILNFLQFFLWGSWLISFGGYLIVQLQFSGAQVGAIYATMGVASLFMPGLLGIIADKWINAERVLGMCHIIGAGLLFWASQVTDPNAMYWIMLLNSMMYMPTISLANSVSYNVLTQNRLDVVKDFPPIRVWGTVGFILAMWMVDVLGWGLSPMQLYIGSLAAFTMGLYSFTMPQCKPSKVVKSKSILSSLGLDAIILFKQRKMATFFFFAMLLGGALQITNTFGNTFLRDFANNPAYTDSFGVKYPNILLSISQISETLFILAIPFFLRRFGIKKVMLMSMLAWTLRFALFGVGNPGSGLYLLVLSMIIYGMAFDFFNISGSLFVEKESDTKIRASAQGLFMIMTNGFGASIGGFVSGIVVDHYTSTEGIRDWGVIWMVFAAYALTVAILFAIFFKYKHVPEKKLTVAH